MTLANIVRAHNGETPLVMDVAQVNASVQIQGNVSPSVANIGGLNALQAAGAVVQTGTTAGGTTGSLGSKVVTSRTEGVNTSFSYQESPTITYTPLSGAALISQISQPIPVSSIAALVQSQWSFPALISLTFNYITPNTKDHYAISNALFELYQYGAVGISAISKQSTNTNTNSMAPNISKSTNAKAGSTESNSLVIFFEPFHAENPYVDSDIVYDYSARYKMDKRIADLWIRILYLYSNLDEIQDNIEKIKIGSENSPVLGARKLLLLQTLSKNCDLISDSQARIYCVEHDVIGNLPREIYLRIDARTETDRPMESSDNWRSAAPIVATYSALGTLKAATEEPPAGPIMFLRPEQFSAVMTQFKENVDKRLCQASDQDVSISVGCEFYEIDKNFLLKMQTFTSDEAIDGSSGNEALLNVKSVAIGKDASMQNSSDIIFLDKEKEIYKNRRFILIIKTKLNSDEDVNQDKPYVTYSDGQFRYSIMDNDTISKRNFSLIGELMSVMAIPAQTQAPSNTISVK